MAKTSEFTYMIEKIYGYLDPEHTVVYCRVAWGDRPAQDEVRKCWIDQKTNKLKLGKGLAMTPKMIKTLKKISELTTDKEGVDFEAIFRSSEGIMEKREAGFRTEDGFYVLKRKERKK